MAKGKKTAKRSSKRENYVYFFGEGKADGAGEMKNLLGGKGANLAEMSRIGIPVPAGFTITTEVCTYYYENGESYPAELEKQVLDNLKKIERVMGAKFNDPKNPLLVSVRSGARVSMPGMMETVLNLGLNDEIAQGLIAKSGNARFVYDAYRRFIQAYGDVVMGVRPEEREHDPFEAAIEKLKERRGVELDTDLNAEELKDLVGIFKGIIKKRTGKAFPEDPNQQLREGRVFAVAAPAPEDPLARERLPREPPEPVDVVDRRHDREWLVPHQARIINRDGHQQEGANTHQERVPERAMTPKLSNQILHGATLNARRPPSRKIRTNCVRSLYLRRRRLQAARAALTPGQGPGIVTE